MKRGLRSWRMTGVVIACLLLLFDCGGVAPHASWTPDPQEPRQPTVLGVDSLAWRGSPGSALYTAGEIYGGSTNLSSLSLGHQTAGEIYWSSDSFGEANQELSGYMAEYLSGQLIRP